MSYVRQHLYPLAHQLFPGMVDIVYDQWVGYVIRFPNRWGNPAPFIRIGGSNGDWHFIWCWLWDQVVFRIEQALQTPVLLLTA